MKFTGEFFVPEERYKHIAEDRELAIEHLQRYNSVLSLVDGKEVLDIASGEGYGSYLFSQKAKKVIGVDINSELIQHASHKYKKDNLIFIPGSIVSIPLDDASVDVVISFETLEHVNAEDQKKFIKEAARVLRNTGVFIVSTPNKRNYSDRFNFLNKFHVNELEEENFLYLLRQSFPKAELFGQGQEIVSLIFNQDSYENKVPLKISPIVDEHFKFHGKYLLAVCGKSETVVLPKISSIVVEGNQSFFDLMERVMELQNEVEKLGAWGQKSAKELEELRKIVGKRRKKEEDKSGVGEVGSSSSTIAVPTNGMFLTAGSVSQLSKQVEEYKNTIFRIEEENKSIKRKLERTFKYKVQKKWDQIFRRKKKAKHFVGSISPRLVFSEEGIKFPVFFPTSDAIIVSIVISVFNKWEFTRNCLLSIYKYNDGIPIEVIVGDDSSTDETRRLYYYFPNVIHVRNERNLGYTRNVNTASSKARGKYILTLNNDTTVTPGWLSSLVTSMESDPKAGLVGSKLVYPNGVLQEAGGIIWQDASGWNYGRNGDPELPQFNYVREVDYVSGASNLVKRELWQQLNGLDETFVPAYFDDSDLAFGIRSLGYKVLYQPLSVVVHYEGTSHGTDVKEGIKQYQVLNKEKFIKKWALELNSQQFPNAEHVFWARDRSRNKKTIVVVDHYVPTYDKDAGSRTIFDYLKLFLDLDFNVKFIPDNFYRSEPYTTVLQQMGIEVLYGSWYNDHWKDWVKENASKIDMVLLSRPHIAIKYIDFIKEHTKASIFYYGHDLHFLREMRQYEIENDPKLLTSSKEWKQLELQLFNKADVVLTPSASELPLIKEMVTNKKIHVIKPYIFLNLRDPIQDFSNRKNILFVGGFTHVPNVDAVLWFVKEVWPLIQYEIDDVKFLIAGSNPPAEINKLSGKDDIDVLGFVSEAALQQLYSQIKLVVIPLRYGAGVKGKTVEAMYNGVPFVTTDFGIEGLPGNISFLKAQNSATEFANEVVRLYTAPKDELCSYSTNATQYIRKNFYYETIKSEMATIFSVSI